VKIKDGTQRRTGANAKRALFIVISDHPGGAERVAFSIAAELARRPGWNVEVRIACAGLADSFSGRALPSSVQVRYGPARSWYVSFPFLPFALLFHRYDLVVTTHIYTNALLSLMRGLGLIRIGRLAIRESMSLFDRFEGMKAQRFRWLYKAYGKEDLVIAQTHYMADHVRPWLPEVSARHLRVIANPVDSARIAAAAAEPLDRATRDHLSGRRNILFCGRMIGFKRPGAALDAFRAAAKDDRHCQLVFMGTGPLETEIKKQAAQSGLGDRVLFLGNRTNPYPVMAACDVGLLTSANEGFPNVVLEMMACRVKLIVITPCAGDLDTLPGVMVTPTFEVGDIAEALREALRSNEDRSGLYPPALEARSTTAFLDQLLGSKAPLPAGERSK
jgi:glycosyltransferase involved in cell wall biosynthesis